MEQQQLARLLQLERESAQVNPVANPPPPQSAKASAAKALAAKASAAKASAANASTAKASSSAARVPPTPSYTIVGSQPHANSNPVINCAPCRHQLCNHVSEFLERGVSAAFASQERRLNEREKWLNDRANWLSEREKWLTEKETSVFEHLQQLAVKASQKEAELSAKESLLENRNALMKEVVRKRKRAMAAAEGQEAQGLEEESEEMVPEEMGIDTE